MDRRDQEKRRTKEELVKDVAKMGEEEYMDFVVSTFKSREPRTQKVLQRRLSVQGNKNAKKVGDSWKGMLAQGEPAEYPSQPKPTTSKEASCSAFKVPFIHQSDLVPSGSVVFVDVEKLSLKKATVKESHKQVASEVAVVNDNRDLILWSFIRWEGGSICQTFPSLTGITKEKLKIGMPMNDVQSHLKMVFEGNPVVGWDVANDISALGMAEVRTLDIAEYFVDENKHFFGKLIQCEAHSAIHDARATRDLYHCYMELKEKHPNFNDYPKAIERSPREPFAFNPNDVCTCPKKKKSKGKYFVPK